MPIRAFVLAVIAAFSPLLGLLDGAIGLGLNGVGFVFGCVLAAYLWFCHQVRAPGRLAGLIAISSGAFILAVVSTMSLSAMPELFPAALAPSRGPGPTAYFVSGMLGSAIVAASFFLLLPFRWPLRSLGARIGMAMAAGGVLGVAGAIANEGFDTIASHLALLCIWQSGMAWTLATLAESRGEASDVAPGPLPVASRVYFAVALSLLALGAVRMIDDRAQGKAVLARRRSSMRAPPPKRRRSMTFLLLRNVHCARCS